MGAGSPEGDPTGGDQEAGRRPGPEGMPKSNAGDQRTAEAQIPEAAAGIVLVRTNDRSECENGRWSH
jgi:hypothetical protein